MKKTILIAALSLGSLCAQAEEMTSTAVAPASENPTEKILNSCPGCLMLAGASQEEVMAKHTEMMTMIDADADGNISMVEMSAACKEMMKPMFAAADTDSDGKINMEEGDNFFASVIENIIKVRDEKMADQEIIDISANLADDSKLKSMLSMCPGCMVMGGMSKEDIMAKHTEMMKAADTDDDGAISMDEMSAAHDAKTKQMFADSDTDGDGMLSTEECEAGMTQCMDELSAAKENAKSSELDTAKDTANYSDDENSTDNAPQDDDSDDSSDVETKE